MAVAGKGGVGKSVLALNFAVCLAKSGYRVVAMDGNLALGNLDVLIRAEPKVHLGHVIFGNSSLKDIMFKGPHGLKVIPASSGILEMAGLGDEQLKRLGLDLLRLANETDYLMIDCGPGLTRTVLYFLGLAHQVIMVAVPEPSAMLDAYAIIKNVVRISPKKDVQLVVNMVEDTVEGTSVYRQINGVAKKFLNREISHLGNVRWDENLRRSVQTKALVVVHFPKTDATLDITAIAIKVCGTIRVAVEPLTAWVN
jgi:flagellar biosynthesis protein FlhG